MPCLCCDHPTCPSKLIEGFCPGCDRTACRACLGSGSVRSYRHSPDADDLDECRECGGSGEPSRGRDPSGPSYPRASVVVTLPGLPALRVRGVLFPATAGAEWESCDWQAAVGALTPAQAEEIEARVSELDEAAEALLAA